MFLFDLKTAIRLNNSIFQYVFILCFSVRTVSFADIGESAAITLAFPYGARTNGMGEVGVALADDESVCYYNPAGLGFKNERWKKGRWWMKK